MRLLEDSLAEEILSGRIKDGDTAVVDGGRLWYGEFAQERRELLPQAVVE